MEDEDLWEFRERWKRELEGRASSPRLAGRGCERQEPRRRGGDLENQNGYAGAGGVNGGVGAVRGDRSSRRAENASHMPACMAMVEELLEGRLTSLMAKMSDTQSRRRKRHSGTANPGPGDAPPAKSPGTGTLVEQLIRDLDEINEVPFFDVQLPYEVALNIFMFLGRTELGRCAQVSKAWKVLAEDEVLWYRLCLNEGYHRGASVSDSPCWKGTLRDCKRTKDNVQHNWKNRIGAISQLQYELGKVLCDVSSCEDLVIAGYTSGDVRLWDTLHWDAGASFLWPNRLRAEVAPRPHVSQVKINQSVAVASYTDVQCRYLDQGCYSRRWDSNINPLCATWQL